MKILIISTMKGFSWGGSEELWYATAQEAMAEGHTVDVVVFHNEPTNAKLKALQSQIAVSIVPERTIVLPPLWKRAICKLTGEPLTITETDRFAFLYKKSYDLCLVSQGSAVDLLNHPDLCSYLQQTHIPFTIVNHLVTAEMFMTDAQRTVVQNLFAKAKHLCFVSAQNRDEFERKLVQSLRDAVLVKNPVNLQVKGVVEWPQNSTAKMAVVARLDANHKGQDLLLAVLQQPQWKERSYQIHFYGTGPHENYLTGLIQFYGLEEKVKLMGHCSDIKKVWAENELLLLTSRTEGLPLTIVEAMLCGRAVVTTNVGDSAVLIEEGKTGWVAESATVQHISEALEKAWQARAQWQAAGIAAYEKVNAFVDEQPGKTLFNLLQEKLQ